MTRSPILRSEVLIPCLEETRPVFFNQPLDLSELDNPYLLVLTPRRERVREHLAVLRIWVDAGTFLPRRVTYEEPDGDSTSLTFEDLRPNVDLPERAFRVDLPSDVLISSTFNGLGLGQAGGL